MAKFHFAEVNIIKQLAPVDNPIMLDFLNNIDNLQSYTQTT